MTKSENRKRFQALLDLSLIVCDLADDPPEYSDGDYKCWHDLIDIWNLYDGDTAFNLFCAAFYWKSRGVYLDVAIGNDVKKLIRMIAKELNDNCFARHEWEKHDEFRSAFKVAMKTSAFCVE